MIRVALWITSAVSFVALAHTTGWAGLFLAVFAFTPLIALIVLYRHTGPVGPYVEARKWDELDPCAHLSTLDRADGIGNRTKEENA